ncbi:MULTISPECIES: hypothetical protein [Bacillus]|uniref:hypothetical protein n=1 Tax=Bacillus TaxID=1386 RepID=UPI000E5C29A2|nr:hypothetical protein [Bacillus velezensis]MDV2631155.1 hypothetical protein [Bacillus velezensis]MED4626686.1 hypothetical protein [Bacillus velezensis]
MKFKFDNDKIFASAQKLGIDVSKDSLNPGIFVESGGERKELTMDDLFSPNHYPEYQEQFFFNFPVTFKDTTSVHIKNTKKSFSNNETVRAA